VFASNPTGMPSAGPSISIPTKLLATGVACALALVVCGTAATVVVASDVKNKLGTRSRAKLLSGVYRVGTAPGKSFRDKGATAAALDSLVAPLGTPTPVAPKDLASLVALKTDGSRRAVSESAPGAEVPAAVPDVLHRRMALSLNLDSLRLADLTDFRRDVQDPWLPLFRDWARGSKQPNLWRYPAGVPDVNDARDLPMRSLLPWRVLFAENESASLLALRDGKSRIALERARENVAGARHFADQPIVIDALLGHLFLRRSLQVLAFVAKSAGDSSTAIRANELDLAAKNYAVTFSVKLLVEPESDARSHAAEEFASNRNIHPSLRAESLSTITLGGCRSLPELVFGFSKKRRDAMNRAIVGIRDIERGAELGARQQRFLEYAMKLHAAPLTDSPRTILGRSALLSAFAWIVPPGVRARAALCMEQGL